MKKYVVLRTNHGFQGRMWVQDAIVEFENDVVPPRHFKLLENELAVKKVNEEIVNEKTALSQLQKKQVKPLPTAGSVLKTQKKVGDKQEDF